MQTRAVILDLDGLIVDSEPIHQRAFNLYLARHNVDYQFGDDEYGRLIVGIPVRANAEYLVERFRLPYDAREVVAEREEIYEALIEEPDNLVPMPGLYDLLNELQVRKIVLGLASGSPRGQVETILRGLGIVSFFGAVVAGMDVARTKPAPDVYMQAVQHLGIPSKFCVAVEDSATGVASAKAAGLRVVVVPNQYTRQQDLSGADLRVARLEQVLEVI